MVEIKPFTPVQYLLVVNLSFTLFHPKEDSQVTYELGSQQAMSDRSANNSGAFKSPALNFSVERETTLWRAA